MYKSYIEGTQKGSGYGGFLSEGFSFFYFLHFFSFLIEEQDSAKNKK